MGGGNLAPSAYTVGPHLSLAGISFGGGLAMVQSPVEDDNSFRAAPYLRVGLSPNFMDGVKAMTSEKGAQNADAPAQSENEDLIAVPATNTPPTLGPRGVESPDSDTDPAAEEADEESAETETTLPDSRPGTTPVITSPPRVP